MTPEQTRHLVTRLRRLADVTHKGRAFLLPEGAIMRLDLVERRLLSAVDRDRVGSPEADGYPRGSLGSGSRSTNDAGDPRSSVEDAAVALIENGQAKDEHHALTSAAFRHLQSAVNSVASLLMALDSIDELSQVSRHSNPGGSCEICTRHVEGTENDRLRRGMCEADYKAWQRADCPDISVFKRMRACA